MKKVLIISYYFPPLNSIAAKRYGTMCKYFKENGYDAYILTTVVEDGLYLGAKRDLDVPVAARKIFRIGRASSGNGFMTQMILGVGCFLQKVKISSRTISAESILWYENVKKVVDLKKFKDIDVVIGTYGPIGNIYVAKYLSKKLGCLYIADIRDLISEWREVPEGYRRCFIIDNIIEKTLLSSAGGITVVTQGFKAILKKKYPKKRISTVYNGWDGTTIEKPCNVKEKYLYYAGSLYEHRLESLSLLLQALRQVREIENIKLIVRSIGPKKLDNAAKKIAEKMGMKSSVEILPPAPEETIKEEQSRAYINIILNSIHKENKEQMITVPGKAYELMHERAPILGIVPKNSDLAALISYTNKGIGTISENEMVEFILHNCNRYKGNSNIMKFSREYQAKRLCKFMDCLLSEK